MPNPRDATRLTAVNHLTYNVTDKERALRFWEDVLGVKQIPSQVDNPNVIWLQLPSGAMVHLVENPEAPSEPVSPRRFRGSRYRGVRETARVQGPGAHADRGAQGRAEEAFCGRPRR